MVWDAVLKQAYMHHQTCNSWQICCNTEVCHNA